MTMATGATIPNYGHVWFPNQVAAGWAPYHTGHWDWIAPWGYTWVDDSAVGLRAIPLWTLGDGRRTMGLGGRTAGAVRPVYAPALVVFIGGGGGGFGGNVGWFPLGPREVYVPSYPVSRGYVNQVNISNTTVTLPLDHECVQHNHHQQQNHEHYERDLREQECTRCGDRGSAALLRDRAACGPSRGCHERPTNRCCASDYSGGGRPHTG